MAKMGSASTPARRYRPRRLQLPDGELLVLRGDGVIEHRDAAGAVAQSWSPEDPEWPQRALRFGIHAAPRTVKPSGRDAFDTKPPG